MEISIVNDSSIKLKGKLSSIVVDPQANTVVPASAVLLTKKGNISFPKLEGLRLVLAGAGEYEVGGIKITGIEAEEETVYAGEIDGAKFAVGSSKAIEKILPKLDETPVLIINAGETFNSSIVSTLSPSVCIIYGVGRDTALKSLGRENLPKTSKYIIKADKLPEEAEVVSLG